MSVEAQDLIADFHQVLQYGERVRFRYYTVSGADTGYDDDIAHLPSGTGVNISGVMVSGMIQPVTNKFGTQDALLLQQGLIKSNDIKIYVDGTVNTSGAFKMGLGSPNYSEYIMASGGIIPHYITGSVVYKTIYAQSLPTGSLRGE